MLCQTISSSDAYRRVNHRVGYLPTGYAGAECSTGRVDACAVTKLVGIVHGDGASLDIIPVSYTHLTLPTNREV